MCFKGKTHPAAVICGAGEDNETHARLLAAAGPIFAAEGFRGARVRDICAAAKANVAAVNYHFGDKIGLYRAVLKNSTGAAPIERVLQEKTPQRRVHAFISMILHSAFDAKRPAWLMKLILREMSDPSPAFEEMLQTFIRPRYALLCALVGELIGKPADSRITQLCAQSVVGQARHYVTAQAVIGGVWPDFRFREAEMEELADHITAFSLAGMRAYRKSKETHSNDAKTGHGG